MNPKGGAESKRQRKAKEASLCAEFAKEALQKTGSLSSTLNKAIKR